MLLHEFAPDGFACRRTVLVVQPDTGSPATPPVQDLNPANTETELANSAARP
jgi:hypothetical protein